MEKLLRKQASKQASKPDVRRVGRGLIDGPGSRAMKLVDETVAPVVHAGTVDETKAARRKTFPESGGAYPGLTSKRCLGACNKPLSGRLPKRRHVPWRHTPAFLNTSLVLPKALLQDRRACLLLYFRPSHLATPYRRRRGCHSPRYPHPA